MKKTLKYILLAFFLCICVYAIYLHKARESIHIALVSAFSGPDHLDGQSFYNGVKLCIQNYNHQAERKKIIIDQYDDQNNPGNAYQMAKKVIQSNALAVIGHNTSECSLAASPVYFANQIPAITPLATHTHLNHENPWYFRTIFNNRFQSQYLSNYIQKVYKHDQIVLLFDKSEYARDIVTQLKTTFHSKDIKIFVHEIKSSAITSVSPIIETKHTIPIVLASELATGLEMIHFLRKKQFQNPLFLPDIFFTKRFVHRLAALQEANSDFSTENIYIVSPLFFETANKNAHDFFTAYKKAYNISPDWIAAYAYDAAQILIKMIHSTDFENLSFSVSDARKQLGLMLSRVNHPGTAIDGVTGWIYFDDNCDTTRPLTMGKYNQHNIIPAMIQFIPETLQGKQIANDPKKNEAETIANIIYTNVNIQRIRNIDINQATATLDFEIYFHYATERCHPEQIKFLNVAQKNITLTPKHERKLANEIWACYEGQGLFYLDQFPGTYLFDRHQAGIQFQHKYLPVSHLIYIQDKQSEAIPQNEAIIDPLSGWMMTDSHVFQDVEMKTTLGNPEYLHAFGGKMGFSRFNHSISFQGSQFSCRGLISGDFAFKVCWISSVLLFMSVFIVQWPRAMWGVITICAFLFVMSGESVLMYGLALRLTDYQLQWLQMGFDIMWWLVPAFCLNMFMQRFVFMSMTQKEKLHVANIVPRFVSFLIYAIACLGIVAFVFEQEISRLLATGGIFAMMIGLAVKMNVADILSGIAINIESPFRLGDWIQIDQYEGMVTDITWRSTRIKTGENAVLCIPNSKATESSIQNYNTPGELNWIKIQVPLSHQVSPEMVENILTSAVFATRDIITDPIPKIFYKGTKELNAWFDIFFCIHDYANRKRRIDNVWTSIWKHLRFAEMQLSMMGHHFSFPQQKLFDILDRLDILDGIGIEDKLELVPHFTRKIFDAGQIIVDHQELTSDEFYIIRKGAVRVYFPSEDGELIEVDRMGAGDYFGETGLLGEAYATQIKAVTDVTIDAISGKILFACVDDREPFLDQLRHLRLRRTLARKQQKNLYEEALAEKDKKKDSILLRLWKFLR